jgi:hypothetical protein
VCLYGVVFNLNKYNIGPQKVPPDEALAFLLHHNISKETYTDLKNMSAKFGANIWPSYNCILEAKKTCRPEGVILQEKQAHVPLQQLLNHTAKRILDQVRQLLGTFCNIIIPCKPCKQSKNV